MTHDTAMRTALQDMSECQAVCQDTLMHCLSKGGQHAEADHIRVLLDCAEMCQTAASFMARVSPERVEICRVCKEICERCAESCERIADDEQMQRCVEACRRCTESCREMAGGRA